MVRPEHDRAHAVPLPPSRDETARAVKALILGAALGLAIVALARRASRSGERASA